MQFKARYKTGAEFLETLFQIYGVKNSKDLSPLIDVSYNTLRSWGVRNVIQFEVAARVAIQKDIPIHQLIIKDEDVQMSVKSHRVRLNAHHLKRGQLVEPFVHFFDSVIDDTVSADTHQAIYHNEAMYIVDSTRSDTGDYFVSFDGEVMMTNIQKLIGGKVQLTRGDTTSKVDFSDLDIVGRVAAATEKL